MSNFLPIPLLQYLLRSIAKWARKKGSEPAENMSNSQKNQLMIQYANSSNDSSNNKIDKSINKTVTSF